MFELCKSRPGVTQKGGEAQIENGWDGEGW